MVQQKTVCGITWYNCYLDTLSEMQKKRIQTEKNNTSFKFGDNPTVEAIKKVKIPTIIGKTSVLLETHIVEADVPLLLSKEALKKANAFINFENDTISIFAKNTELVSHNIRSLCFTNRLSVWSTFVRAW